MRALALVVAGLALAPAGAAAQAPPRGAVAVYPSPGTPVASARTQISVRGATRAQVARLRVTGSRSGAHAGRVLVHGDGAGASFVPRRPFRAGERVTVRTGLRVAGARGGVVRFAIAVRRPFPVPPAPGRGRPSTAGIQRFHSELAIAPPAVAVTQSTAPAAEGSFFVAPKAGDSQPGPMIFDTAGRLVWFHPVGGGRQAFDFRTQTYRGAPVLTWWEGRLRQGSGAGEGVIYDAAYRPLARVRAGNGYSADLHEFRLTPRGTALLTIYDSVRADLRSIGGPRDGAAVDGIVQEVDVATGAVLFEWHSLGHVALADTVTRAPAVPGGPVDYFHVNSVDEERDGALLISGRHTEALYEVDRATGRLRWTIGGRHSSFRVSPAARFGWQHDARRQPDGTITVFDNRAPTSKRGRGSRALVLSVDERARTVTAVRQFRHTPPLLATSQGGAQRLPDGSTVVGWGGGLPIVSEFDALGRPTFEARMLARGVDSYRAYRLPWSARPASRPALALVTAGGRSTAYASWNGATAVAAWRVLAGARATALRAVATAARTGFETAVALASGAAVARVQALDDAGRVLATSRAVRARGR